MTWSVRLIVPGAFLVSAGVTLFNPQRAQAQNTPAVAQPGSVGGQVTVITREELERRNIGRLDELFEGLVPGMFAARASTNIAQWNGRGTIAPNQTAAVKVFVNGVELVEMSLLSTINPEFVDRVEVRTGAAAGALAGYNAPGGVILISTVAGKGDPDDRSRPVINALVSAGNQESLYGSGNAVMQRHALSMSGVASGVQYIVAGGFSGQGAFAPRTGGRASDVFANVGVTRPWGSFSVFGLMWRGVSDLAPSRNPLAPGEAAPIYDDDLRQHMIGTNFTLTPTPRWRTTVYGGINEGKEEILEERLPDVTSSDHWIVTRNISSKKLSLGLRTAVTMFETNGMTSTFSAGVAYQHDDVGGKEDARANDGPSVPVTYQQDFQYTSIFGAVDVTLARSLELSVGIQNLRAGNKLGNETSPRVGAAYTHAFGMAAVTLRTAYGVTNGPNDWSGRVEQHEYSPGYEPALWVQVLANKIPMINTKGLEGGVDIAVANGPRVSFTLFDQRGTNGSMLAIVDSIAAVHIASGNTVYFRQYQAQPDAEYTTRGMEITMQWKTGKWIANGAYTLAKTEITRIPDGVTSPAYVLDEPFNNSPRAIAGMEVSYAVTRATLVGVEARYLGGYRERDYLVSMPTMRSYPSFATFNLNASHALRPGVRVIGFVQNLTNAEKYAATNGEYVRGRVAGMGLRVRY